MDLYDVIKKPIVTEKAEALRRNNCYVFEVQLDANKVQVARAIKQIFGVTPEKVNIVNRRAKEKRNRRGAGYTGRKKKAYVYLKKNDKITLFEGV